MLGHNIKLIRQKKKLTLSQCAEQANISKSYLSNIERNVNQNPSIHIIYRLASVLDVDPRILVGGEHAPETDKKEWSEIMKTLDELGIEKEELHEYKTIIEFAKWKKAKK